MEGKRKKENNRQKVFIPELKIFINNGEKVPIPYHNILNVDGTDTNVPCPSITGVCVVNDTFPNPTGRVECENANNPKAKQQCAKKWSSSG